VVDPLELGLGLGAPGLSDLGHLRAVPLMRGIVDFTPTRRARQFRRAVRRRADAAAALAAYQSFDWAGAMLEAEEAYRTVMDAAAASNVQVEPQASQADYKARGQSCAFVDPVHHHRDE
jgi:hypothetical protein